MASGEEDNVIKLDIDTPELIPVREGEELNLDKLADFLEGKLDGATGKPEVMQFAGGHANLTYCLNYGEAEYVLRRPPIGPVAETSHDMGREYRILSKLFTAYPAAPKAFLYCEDPEIIGAPFFIMERRRGIVVRGTVPPEYGGGNDVEKNRIISEVLVDMLAELHLVDFQQVGLSDLGKPEGYMARQITGWAKRFERAKTEEVEVLNDLVAWLQDKIPDLQSASILHNDWRLDNIMLDPKDPGKAVAVFDWDMGTLGDPLADMGCLLSLWIEAGEGLGMGSSGGVMPTQVPGFLTRQQAIERYGEKTGFDITKMPFYYSFGQFKMSVILQQIYYRYHVGQTHDKRFKYFGKLAELLINLAYSNAINSNI